MIRRDQFIGELRAAGVNVWALSTEGDHEGQAVLADGTLIRPDGTLGHVRGGTPDAAAAALYRSCLTAHVPGPAPQPPLSPEQRLAALEARVAALEGGAR